MATETIVLSRDSIRMLLPREPKTHTVDAVCPVDTCHEWLTSRGLNGHGVNACADAVQQHLYDRHALGTGDTLVRERGSLAAYVPGAIQTGGTQTIELIDWNARWGGGSR